MKKLFIVSIFLFSGLAEARLAGNWAGWGSWTYDGDTIACNPMQMQWSETTASIAIEKGYFDCGLLGMDLGRTAWALKDGVLFDENQKNIGTYDGQQFEAVMPSPYENTTIHIKLRREANHFDYVETWFNATGKVYIIKGRLFMSGVLK